ncbi:fluoride efflux transporter CrcB [Roseateles chitinivorans]|uniref:fluoride efflux transporter CrcB n=1 Tax=Roseateles chitinivorans TaxID=2917965 RepID=UPI003D66DEBE
MVNSFFAVVVGGALGCLLRWGLGLSLNLLFPAIPPGTLAANLIGGYLVGVAFAYFGAHPELPAHWRLFVITGFLGGLTTFSSFSAEIVQLLRTERPAMAAIAVTMHLGGSLLLTAAGILTVGFFRGR